MAVDGSDMTDVLVYTVEWSAVLDKMELTVAVNYPISLKY